MCDFNLYLFYPNMYLLVKQGYFHFNIGQRVNMTLVDFGLWSSLARSDPTQFHCDKLATLSEPGRQADSTICAGAQRMRHAYTSKNSTLDVVLWKAKEGRPRREFLLKYEGNVYPLFIH